MIESVKRSGLSIWLGLFFLLSPGLPGFAQDVDQAPAVERITWNKTPLPITLRVGLERQVSFPGDVRIGVPLALQSILRTQSVNGTAYWLADQTFSTQRIQIQIIESGEIMLVDLKALDQFVSNTPIEIISNHGRKKRSKGAGYNQHETGETIVQHNYVTLTRHAAQQLYAPLRLVRTPPGVSRISIHRKPVPLVRGAPIEALPLVAWRSGGLYISAVQLRNLDTHPIVLDPRHLRGQWLAATFQHARLHSTGSEANTTAVYLISARPFEEAL